VEKEFICMLHSKHDCENRNYSKLCAMREDSGFAKRTCQYRVAAVVLAAAEPEESPENVVQQTNGDSQDSAQIAADTVEFKDLF
jgi:hypothetical protein